MIITNVKQVKALQSHNLLKFFLEPTSPSEVAKALNQPANRIHYYVKRYLSLGLLEHVNRIYGKDLYQLKAKTFKYPRSLLPATSPNSTTKRYLDQLVTRFEEAFIRSELQHGSEEDDWVVFNFDSVREEQDDSVDSGNKIQEEMRPPFVQLKTVKMSPEQYKRFVLNVSRQIDELGPAEVGSGKPCTVSFVAFEGEFDDDVSQGEFIVSSFPRSTSSDKPPNTS